MYYNNIIYNMSNQVYRNNLNEKYSPSKIVNKFEVATNNQIIPAGFVPNSVYFNKVNGVTTAPVAGVIDYVPLLLSGSDNIIPIYNSAVKPYTYFKVMKSGTYTMNFVLVMQGVTVTNEMRGVGIAVTNAGTLVPEQVIRALNCQWGPSSGVVNPGEWCLSASYTGYLNAGQTFFPCIISTNGINSLFGTTSKGQTTVFEYFEN